MRLLVSPSNTIPLKLAISVFLYINNNWFVGVRGIVYSKHQKVLFIAQCCACLFRSKANCVHLGFPQVDLHRTVDFLSQT